MLGWKRFPSSQRRRNFKTQQLLAILDLRSRKTLRQGNHIIIVVLSSSKSFVFKMFFVFVHTKQLSKLIHFEEPWFSKSFAFMTDLCRRGGLVAGVRSTPDRAVRVRDQAGDIVLCFWARHLTPTVPLSTQVYEWVPENLMLGVTLRWTSIPSRGK